VTGNSVTAYYLPFSVETFLPVTVDSIEKDARCTFSFERSSEDSKSLQAWLARLTSDGFDKKRVRLKLVGLEAAPVFVDADGGVRRGRSSAGRLEQPAFKALEQLIEAAAVRAGCDPHG
jgi:hypothetical protein